VWDDLERAARAYNDALAAVAEARQRVADARAVVPDARRRLAEAIVNATLAGARQHEIAAITGYSRESVRRIQRQAGVESDD
jgi:hypothetical protein